ncbi:MAG: DNA primase [Deltaproteobacteria bacterium]|nr:DNA primase [Deltaproteobacteria bacterium]
MTDEIKKNVEARKQAEKEASAAAEKKDDPITPKFVEDCLYANELGDGALFAALHQGRFIFNKTTGRWLRWAGHHWELDVFEKVYVAVEEVAQRYLGAAAALMSEITKAIEEKESDKTKKLRKKQEMLNDRARRLRGPGAALCLDWAPRVADGLSAREEQFDINPWFLACANGVIELATGRFRPGRPGDMITRAVPHAWTDIDCPAPGWEKFVDGIMDGNAEHTAYLQRFFGYGITGLVKEHKFAVLYGEEGRNGKGTLVETLKYVLGPLAEPIQTEMLLDQRFSRSSSGPSPDIMSLKGLRLAFASEIEKGRRFSASQIKRLTGGDTLKARSPNDKYETVFPPTHLLCLLTNHLPHAPAEDGAFWDRMHAIPFTLRFVDNPAPDSNDRPRDKDLPEKLREETPGILAWLVRGCIEWQRQGLNPPARVTRTTEQYRFTEDVLANFLADCCESPENTPEHSRVKYNEVHKAFKLWFEAEHGDLKYIPKKKVFGQSLDKRFRREEKGGHVWVKNIALKPNDDDQFGWNGE